MEEVWLGLGSNLGDREANLREALQLLSRKVAIEQVSSIYETEPIGYQEQPWFLNLACRGLTQLKPSELLSFVKEIEKQLGREPSFPNAPRPIDIDILFYGEQIINSKDLIIPHPRLSERAFVLIPLAEISPGLIHPVFQRSISELLAALSGSQSVRKWKDVSSLSPTAF